MTATTRTAVTLTATEAAELSDYLAALAARGSVWVEVTPRGALRAAAAGGVWGGPVGRRGLLVPRQRASWRWWRW